MALGAIKSERSQTEWERKTKLIDTSFYSSVSQLVRESMIHNRSELQAILEREKRDFYMANVFGVQSKAFVAKLLNI